MTIYHSNYDIKYFILLLGIKDNERVETLIQKFISELDLTLLNYFFREQTF